MTNPTRKEILDAQLARQWAERNKACEVSSPEIQAAANFILAHTNPLTMAEVEWDGDKHRFAEAEHEYRDRVVMLSAVGVDGIKCLEKDGDSIFVAARCLLTPTGRRYTLAEVQDD